MGGLHVGQQPKSTRVVPPPRFAPLIKKALFSQKPARGLLFPPSALGGFRFAGATWSAAGILFYHAAPNRQSRLHKASLGPERPEPDGPAFGVKGGRRRVCTWAICAANVSRPSHRWTDSPPRLSHQPSNRQGGNGAVDIACRPFAVICPNNNRHVENSTWVSSPRVLIARTALQLAVENGPEEELKCIQAL